MTEIIKKAPARGTHEQVQYNMGAIEVNRVIKRHEIEISSMTVKIPVTDKPKVVVIDRGQCKEYELPEHGETVVVTQDNRVQRLRFVEGEKF